MPTLTQQIHARLIAEGKMQIAPRYSRDQLLGRDMRRRLASGLRRASWEGPLAKRPGDYRVTALVPHCDTPALLKLCLGFLRRQTERPYVMVVDTGTSEAKLPEVLALRDNDVEIHQVACHGTDHPVAAVCYAMDLGLAACRGEFLWCVHSDCFVTNRRMLAELLVLADGGKYPCIGYSTMPKPELASSATLPPVASAASNRGLTPGYPRSGSARPCDAGILANSATPVRSTPLPMVSHTCTLLHVPTLDDLDVTWSMRRLKRQAEKAARAVHIDTEMALNYRLLDPGVVPMILGDETADEIEIDSHRVHLRAATARRIYLVPDRDDSAIVARLQKLLEEDGEALPEQALGSSVLGLGTRRQFRQDQNPRPKIQDQRSVSIIVAARNYGHFLRQCLRSCLKQSHRAVEVIYVDDASDDDSVALARQIEGLTVVRAPCREGVVAARNRGVAASRGEVLVHVDGDDVLPLDFVAKHLESLRGDTPFVYGPAQCFGVSRKLWPVLPWHEHFLWDANQCNTSSAIWRWAFQAAGGWRDASCDSPDWHLFLRAARLGVPAASKATLLYRQHEANWSAALRLAGRVDSGRVPLRRSLARVSIGCIYSGRLPGLLGRWIAAIARNAQACPTAEPPDLTILDNSADASCRHALYEVTAAHLAAFSRVVIEPFPVRLTWSNEAERQNRVARFMADATARLLALASGELVWLVEDDILPPDDALAKLFERATEGECLPAAVSALYRSRHVADDWIAGWWRDGALDRYVPQGASGGRKPPVCERPTGDAGYPQRGSAPVCLDADSGGDSLEIDLAGTGCLLFWRGLAPATLESHLGCFAAHDWALTWALRQAKRSVVLLPAVSCRHYRTEGNFV
jgi:hypothetical protein